MVHTPEYTAELGIFLSNYLFIILRLLPLKLDLNTYIGQFRIPARIVLYFIVVSFVSIIYIISFLCSPRLIHFKCILDRLLLWLNLNFFMSSSFFIYLYKGGIALKLAVYCQTHTHLSKLVGQFSRIEITWLIYDICHFDIPFCIEGRQQFDQRCFGRNSELFLYF